MKTLRSNTEITVYSPGEELPKDIQELLKLSHEAAERAYAPYSKFKVGAAIMLNNGKIVTGNNQENAAYPSGLCAERTAAFYASSQYPEVPFSKIAITAISPDRKLEKPISPCGACRQVLLEYAQKFNQNIEIILASDTGEVYVFGSIMDLIPFSFGSDYLN